MGLLRGRHRAQVEQHGAEPVAVLPPDLGPLGRDANRERDLEEFMKNKSYYTVRARLNSESVDAGISDGELRRLSTAAGLMARVSRTDHESTEAELKAIARALQSYWSISAEVAHVAAEATVSGISLDTDPLRLAREFMDITTEEERVRFMDVLFAVAVADGFVSDEELSEIGSIASWLYLPRKAFIDAKVRIPAEQRAG